MRGGMVTHTCCAKPGNQDCPCEDNPWEKLDCIINSWLGECWRQPCQQPERGANNLSRGNVPTADLHFLQGLIQSNPFTSHSQQLLKQPNRGRRRGRRRRRQPAPLPRSTPQNSAGASPACPPQGCRAGAAHPAPAGRDKCLMRVLAMQGTQQLPQGLCPSPKMSCQRENLPGTSWDLQSHHLFFPCYFFSLSSWPCDNFLLIISLYG